MKNKWLPYIVAGVILLSAIGIISDPANLIRQLFIAIIIISLIYVIFHFIAVPGNSVKKEQRAFLKAAKQSKRRVKKQPDSKNSYKQKQALRKKSAVHLTVIEGKKGKKKSRALH